VAINASFMCHETINGLVPIFSRLLPEFHHFSANVDVGMRGDILLGKIQLVVGFAAKSALPLKYLSIYRVRRCLYDIR